MMSIASLFKAFFLLGITLLATGPVTNAQSAAERFEKLPACAKLCIVTAYSAMNNACAQTDAACFCKNNAFITTSGDCYTSSCKGDDLATARAWGISSCAQVGVTLHAPASTNATTPNSANTTTASSGNTTTAPSGSSTPAQDAKSSASLVASSIGFLLCSSMAIFLNM
ncbi:hypothetical protein PGT21_007448 [Puccinia graminis f. sp. tritici]|uniref:CFEM domain-containing protein n=1 Tax=Puccinia graminis f. sp. tritici TaxID=56615 RepID=A0A5B0MN34_PUCGR|nr:hypothetical protein PGT21_007448 [Puccinia graminis f. sp. tritici]